jgi:imidazolonepropionase-like amidohydrolase
MGYDSGPPGASANELVRMADAGLGAAAAIRAATAGSACALGLTDVGTVEPGRFADFLVVDRDPLDDPSVLLEPDRVRLVIQAGRVVAGARPEPSDIRP